MRQLSNSDKVVVIGLLDCCRNDLDFEMLKDHTPGQKKETIEQKLEREEAENAEIMAKVPYYELDK